MDPVKDKFERAVGENFIRWYNQKHLTNFALYSRQENPDLTYRDGRKVLHVEVTSAYYDKYVGEEDDRRHAEFLWQNARGVPDAPGGFGGSNLDRDLIANINRRLNEKCVNNYGSNCVLVIDIRPILTPADDLEAVLGDIRVPSPHYFVSIYLTGEFPQSSTSPAGYRCWRLDR